LHRSTFHFQVSTSPKSLTFAIRSWVYRHTQTAISRGFPAHSPHFDPESPHLSAQNAIQSFPKSLTFDGIASQTSLRIGPIRQIPESPHRSNRQRFQPASLSSDQASQTAFAPVKPHLNGVNAQKEGKIGARAP
jgi:hypothetical protein